MSKQSPTGLMLAFLEMNELASDQIENDKTSWAQSCRTWQHRGSVSGGHGPWGRASYFCLLRFSTSCLDALEVQETYEV